MEEHFIFHASSRLLKPSFQIFTHKKQLDFRFANWTNFKHQLSSPPFRLIEMLAFEQVNWTETFVNI